MTRKARHRFEGAPKRFVVVAEFIYDRYGNTVQWNIGIISDQPARLIAGGTHQQPGNVELEEL